MGQNHAAMLAFYHKTIAVNKKSQTKNVRAQPFMLRLSSPMKSFKTLVLSL